MHTNTFGQLFSTVILFFFVSSLAYAQFEKIGITLEAGINKSDMQYGSELIRALLPRDDYNSLEAGGESGRAYTFGLGTEIPVYKGLYALARVNYTVFRYQIEGEVNNLKSTVTRPPGADIVVAADGDLDYQFIEISAGISYHLNDNPKRGLFGTMYLSHLIHLNRNWDLDVTFENGVDGNLPWDRHFEQLSEFNNLRMAGAEVGVRLPLSSKVTVAPKFGFQLGLNPVEGSTITPMASTGAIQLSTWF